MPLIYDYEGNTRFKLGDRVIMMTVIVTSDNKFMAGQFKSGDIGKIVGWYECEGAQGCKITDLATGKYHEIYGGHLEKVVTQLCLK